MHMHRARLEGSLAATVVTLVIAACTADITGAAPQLAEPAAGAAAPVDPGVVCRDQLTTIVTVHGDGFSPLPHDLASDPATWLPSVIVTRAATLAGAAGDGVSVMWDGRLQSASAPGAGVNGDALRWISQRELSFEVRPQMTLADGNMAPLPEGVFDVTVRNANGAEGTSHAAFVLVPKPTLTASTPNLVCLAQGPRTLSLAGESLLRLDGREPVLSVADVDEAFALSSFSGCADIPYAALDASLCTGAEVALGQDSVPIGEHAMTLLNPETAACHSEDDVRLRVVPPPSIDHLEPPAECTAEATQDVVIVGADLLEVDGTKPAVTMDGAPLTVVAIGGTCADLPTQGHTVRACTTLTVTVPVEAPVAPRRPTIVVTNPEPAGCVASTSTDLVLVPEPTVSDIQPPVLCDDGSDQVLHFAGQWLFTVDGATPTVSVDGTALPAARVAAASCEDVGVVGLAVAACTSLDVTVNPADVDGSDATFEVRNPTPVECGVTYPIDIPLVEPPRIDSVAPSLVCTDDGARALTISGEGFIRVGAALPTVTLSGAAATVDSMSGCAPAGIGTVPSAEACTTLNVTAAAGSIAPGAVTVTIASPVPVGCAVTSSTVLVAPPHLVIDAVEPDSVCTIAGDKTVTVTGAGFVVVDGALPTVTLAGDPFAIVPGTMGGCVDLAAPGLAAQACTAFQVSIPAGALAEGDVAVAVTNPAPDGCAETATGVLFSVPVPDVTSVEPTAFCSAQGGDVTVHGHDFSEVAKVSLSIDGGVIARGQVTFVSDTELAVHFGNDIDPGVYDVVVDNAAGCSDTLPLAVEVHPTPLVFFVDPPVDYNGITIDATVYLSGLDAPAAEVLLVGPNGEQQVLVGTSKPDEPNRIAVRLPAGLAPGDWAVQVTSQIGCVGILNGAFVVTDRLTFTIDAVDPAYVWSGTSTPITMTSNEGGFVKTPRAYMNPKDAPEGTPATNVRAVLFDDATTLTGVIPAGLAPDQEYELIVVNPDGTVGIHDPVTVTADAPPLVTAILPASLDANGTQRATISGDHFTTDGMTASMLCRRLDGSTVGPLTVTPVAASLTTTAFDADFPADVAGAGAVCVVTVTSSSGASFRFSAISIKTPAQNLNAWRDAGVLLNEPRRALGLAAGRPTTQSRFLYAVGGDEGAVASAKASIESASVGLFGDIGAFAAQRHELPAPRTFAGVTRVGGFVYVVGGNDGAAPVASVWRAPILDPLAAPEVVDLGVELLDAYDDRPGVGAGLWIYRIAAIFAPGDAVDPDGESLPGEPLVVQLPAVDGIALLLTWDAVPEAVGYRVYRTPAADMGVDEVELLGTVMGAQSFYDAGDAATDALQTPLPAGSLGRWSLAGTLTVDREAPAVAAAVSPSDASVTWLYAFGGRSTNNGAVASAPVASWERAAVSITPASSPKDREHQSTLTFAAGPDALRAARAEGAAFVVRAADVEAGIPAGRTWIYVGPGRTANGTTDTVDAGLVMADGGLGSVVSNVETAGLVAPAKRPSGAAGYGIGVANGFLFTFGGAGGAASKGGISGEMCLGVGVGGCNPDRLPEVRNWNSLGIDMTLSRVWMGSVQESAFFFLAGGFDGVTVTRRVDTTVQ